MVDLRPEAPRWRVSRQCSNGACVEVAEVVEGVLIRDSKDPQGPILSFTPAEWQAFKAGVRAGDFD